MSNVPELRDVRERWNVVRKAVSSSAGFCLGRLHLRAFANHALRVSLRVVRKLWCHPSPWRIETAIDGVAVACAC